MNAVRAQLALRGELRLGEPLSRHCWWAVGGPAQRFYVPADIDDLAAYLASRPVDEPLFWLGLGSNLLVRDGGLAGSVLALAGALDELHIDAGGTLTAGAGAACNRVARSTARAGLGGTAFLAGIPGTMGGALAMNAGAHGGDTWSLVRRVQTIDRGGRLRWREPQDFQVGYRSVRGPHGEWFVRCELQLPPCEPGAALQAIKDLLAHRARTQPTGQRSCGSVFRNPQGDHAGRLIEAAGLKGLAIGGARVSDKHANFIINDGSASAADLEQLIDEVRRRVEAHSGVRLQAEVCIVGDAGEADHG